jgi:hypothetical protein
MANRRLYSDPQSDATEDRLRWLVQHSGVIFAGQVVGINRSLGTGWVEVTFRVDSALRGVRPGPFQVKSLESAPGSFPLRPGEQIVIFLHTPNQQKTSSIVGGICGLLPSASAGKTDMRGLRFCTPQLTPEAIRPHPGMQPADLQRAIPLTEPPAILSAESSSIATSDLLLLLSPLIGDSRATTIRPPAWNHEER